MADCTKAVNFLREWDRMCQTFDERTGCIGCPVNSAKGDLFCSEFRKKQTKKAIAIVQQWSDEHPQVTWRSKLVELLPHIELRKLYELPLCPGHYFGNAAPIEGECHGFEGGCESCWDGEYKERG